MLLTRDLPLNNAQLRRLAAHKYSCSSASVLDPYMQPWWNWLVGRCPLWLAPNVITLVGLLVNIATTLVMVACSPAADRPVPRWACVLAAAGLFIYQSLDAIDGKQARRTGSSSPLGELFDHGCDAVSVAVVAVGFCTVMSLGEYPMWLFVSCFVAMALFYSAHWQTFVSGTLKFGQIDVTEEQWFIIGLHLLAAVFGSDVYNKEVMAGVKLKMLPVYSATVPVLLHVIGTARVVLAGGCGKNGSSVADTSVLSPSIPLALVVVPAYVICRKSSELVFERHPLLYVFAFSMVAAKITCRLVVAHMSRSELSYLDSSLIGPCMLFLNQYFNTFFSERLVLWLCLAWATADFIDYWHKVCRQLCQHLGIRCFSIDSSRAHAQQRANDTTATVAASGAAKSGVVSRGQRAKSH